MSRRARGQVQAAPAKRSSRLPGLLAGALVFLAGCAVFAPSLKYAFLNWDDPTFVLQYPWIELTAANVKWVFTHAYVANYLPLYSLSYMVDHALWGLRPFGFHLTSVLLHGVNALLCFVVARRMSRSLAVGLIAALLFAVHPSHPEAVAWVTSRKDLLSTAFLLLSLWFYLDARRGAALRAAPYAASIVCFLAALLSKVSGIALPAFLLLVDALPGEKRPRPSLVRALAEKISYGAIAGILSYVNSRAQVTARAAYAHDAVRYLAVKGQAIWNYIALLFGFGGNPDYDLPRLAGAGELFALAGWLIVPLGCWLLVRARRRVELLGVAWTFLMLLPALIFPLVTYMADRYLYAPSIGFCMAAAVALDSLKRPVRWVVIVAVLVALTARTLAMSRIWKDSESLWTYALTKSRDFRAFNNLAQVRMDQKRYAEAERLLRQGAAVDNVVSWQSLAVLHYQQGRYPEALAETDRAIAIAATKPPDAMVGAELRYNRGAVLWALGRTPEAAEEWRAALRLNPRHARAREWLDTVAKP